MCLQSFQFKIKPSRPPATTGLYQKTQSAKGGLLLPDMPSFRLQYTAFRTPKGHVSYIFRQHADC